MYSDNQGPDKPVLIVFSGNQGPQGVHGQGKKQGKTYFFKVGDLSGNFEIGQENLKIKQEVRKCKGISK